MPPLPPFEQFAAIVVVIFLAIGFHEYAHAKLADNAGDPTPRYYGRVTLNLTKHFEPVGTIMMLITALTGFGIGWGKPVPMNPSKMKNPRWDHFFAVLGGPFSNFLQAAFFAIVFRVVILANIPIHEGSFFAELILYGIILNLSICCFNLIPLGPLDGMWILGTFLDEDKRLKWTRWNLTQGQFVFILLILIGQFLPQMSFIRLVIQPPVKALFHFLTGVPL